MRLDFLSLVAVLAGCASNSPTAQQACSQSATEACSQLQMCSAADFQRRWPDLATCEQRQTLACTDALAAPHNANTASKVETCSNAREAQSCADFLSSVTPPTACTTPDGSLAVGAACSFGGQCSTGFCAIAPTALCGQCAAQPAAGDSCAAQGCGQTLQCVAATMQCQAPVAANGACSKSLPCGQSLSCVGATASAMGACMPQGATVGAACDAKQATGPNCDPAAGLVCNTMTNQCVMQPLVGAGMTCGSINGVVTGCSAGSSCKRATGSPTGTCVAPAADGAACDTVDGPDCITPAKCVTSGASTAGTCQLPGSTSC